MTIDLSCNKQEASPVHKINVTIQPDLNFLFENNKEDDLLRISSSLMRT